MQTSTYKLLKVSGGITLFSEVAVSITSNSESQQIIISSQVCDWMESNRHGWPTELKSEYFNGARRGVEYAIEHLPKDFHLENMKITIEKIVAVEVDSTSDTVAYAACFAIWQALNIAPIKPPQICGRKIIFE
jgi:hypothetical protein